MSVRRRRMALPPELPNSVRARIAAGKFEDPDWPAAPTWGVSSAVEVTWGQLRTLVEREVVAALGGPNPDREHVAAALRVAIAHGFPPADAARIVGAPLGLGRQQMEERYHPLYRA